MLIVHIASDDVLETTFERIKGAEEKFKHSAIIMTTKGNANCAPRLISLLQKSPTIYQAILNKYLYFSGCPIPNDD